MRVPTNSDAVPNRFQRAVTGRRCGSREAKSTCMRGGREVFSGLDFEAASGEALAVTGPQRLRARPRCCASSPGFWCRRADRSSLEGGDAELTPARTIALSRPSRCAEAGAQRRTENLAFWRDFLGGTTGGQNRPMPRGRGRLDHATASARGLSLGRPAAAAVDRPPARRCARPVWLLDEPTSALDTAGAGRCSSDVDARASGGRRHRSSPRPMLPLGIDAQRTADGRRGK